MADRQHHWEQVYRSKESTAVSWYQKYPEQSIRLIERVVQSKAQPIIDVGGGASVLVDNLLQRGYSRLAVLDISAKALDCIRQRLCDKAQQVEWFVTDVTNFTPPHRFALWHDRAVFHFLTDSEDRAKYIAVLQRALEPGAHLVIATFAPDGPAQCSGLPVERYDGVKIAQTLGESFQLLEQQSESHTTPAGGEQRFNYFLFRYQPR
ncbi:MAG: class I SAM-dependent methyltransferase [Gammaproteobacteria bacterium]|nr:class I SAM-dependent methyltransferase [Gammaproteobacteria bacterium]